MRCLKMPASDSCTLFPQAAEILNRDCYADGTITSLTLSLIELLHNYFTDEAFCCTNGQVILRT